MNLSRHQFYILCLLFMFSVTSLFIGIQQPTAITGKDEYLIGLRTPMHMIEGDHGWLPWLDGEPRLKKPPVIYWLGKISYEVFGISLLSARLISVLFATLFIITASLFAWVMYRDTRRMLLAGLVLAGMAGIMIDGRRLLLDIPVACMSGLSVLFMYLWINNKRRLLLFASAFFLAVAFMIKGPVALIFFLAAMVAAIIVYKDNFIELGKHKLTILLALLIFMVIAVPWYLYINIEYPTELRSTLAGELEAREFFNFSLSSVLNLIVISLPWSIVALYVIYTKFRLRKTTDDGQTFLFLLLWMTLSLLPFIFFRSFGRYLYGCLLPMTLIISGMAFDRADLSAAKIWFRVGALLSLLVGTLLLLIVLWFRGLDVRVLFVTMVFLLFAITWWKCRNINILATVAVFYWVSVIGILYPILGINKVPPQIIQKAANEYVVLYAGPQPAMLPMALRRGLRATSRLWTLPDHVIGQCKGFLLVSPVNQFAMAQKQMSDLRLTYTEIERYRVLSSRGSWIRFTREGLDRDDWIAALKNRDMDSLGTELMLVRILPEKC
jgi:4-amino-4-deoxy-L-arabinose transferase-like glycosyltransferase